MLHPHIPARLEIANVGAGRSRKVRAIHTQKCGVFLLSHSHLHSVGYLKHGKLAALNSKYIWTERDSERTRSLIKL
jgi:hypothetical protein